MLGERNTLPVVVHNLYFRNKANPQKSQSKVEPVRELRSKYNVSDLTKLSELPRMSFYYKILIQNKIITRERR